MNDGTARPPGVTVAVCCHNSAARLPETLRHLAAQSVPDETPWEVVVVDNASTDHTHRIAQETWAALGLCKPLRLVQEEEPGLVAARNRALQAASYEFVLFCDDDNWLDEDYVRIVYDVMSRNPEIGALGGVGEPVFGAPEPAWFKESPQYYAVGEQAERSGDITDKKGYVYGAAFAIRNSALRPIRAQGFTSLLRGFRRGSNDIELCCQVQLAGYRVWYDDRLRFRHMLPAERLTWKYFLRLTEKAHESGVFVSPYRFVLANGGSYGTPSRFHWLARAAQLLAKLCRRSLAGLKYLDREGYAIHARNRRLIGELRGWLAVRGRYSELCDRVHRLQARLVGRPRESMD